MDQTIETNQLKQEDLQRINQYTRRNFTEKELFSFTVVLCDNEVDRDGEAFTTQSLQELKPLYLGEQEFLTIAKKVKTRLQGFSILGWRQTPNKKPSMGNRTAV